MFTGLVERVFLRIGSAETDEQLEAALTKFLPPVILKLDSKEEGVRKKVCSTHSTHLSILVNLISNFCLQEIPIQNVFAQNFI